MAGFDLGSAISRWLSAGGCGEDVGAAGPCDLGAGQGYARAGVVHLERVDMGTPYPDVVAHVAGLMRCSAGVPVVVMLRRADRIETYVHERKSRQKCKNHTNKSANSPCKYLVDSPLANV